MSGQPLSSTARLSLAAKYAQCAALMRLDKLRGRKVVTWHLSSAGHVQFFLPIFTALRRRGWPISLYVAMDYPMQDKIGALGVPAAKCFPATLAPRLTQMDMFIEGEIYGRGPANAIKVFCGHGQPNKFTVWAPENLRAFDVYFLYGPLEREMFEVIKTSDPENTRHIRLMDIGYPKLDDQLQGRYDRKAVLQGLGLDPALPTLIYAPAWDPGCSLRVHGVQIARTLLEIEGVNVLVKLHPASMEPSNSPYFEFYTGGKIWKDEFAVLQGRPRFRFVAEYLINPLLAASDVMVTDFSGVALEFMTLNRPVLYIESPEFYDKTQAEWKNDRELSKHDDRFNAGRNYGVVVNTLDEMKAAACHALAHPEDGAAQRRAFIARFLYNPGRGADASADAIGGLLHLPTVGMDAP